MRETERRATPFRSRPTVLWISSTRGAPTAPPRPSRPKESWGKTNCGALTGQRAAKPLEPLPDRRIAAMRPQPYLLIGKAEVGKREADKGVRLQCLDLLICMSWNGSAAASA